MTRILIADGSNVVRRLLKLLIGEAKDGQDAVRKSNELKPDAIILDLDRRAERSACGT
jgi:CheY-like chemotaxis protein